MNAVAQYDVARRALGEAKTLDEVKDIADRASALKEYARRASDRSLEIDATELRIRAERRLGEMLKATSFSPGGRPRKDGKQLELATLREIGVDHKLSSRAQKLAALPTHLVDQRLAVWRQNAECGEERVSIDLLRGAAINGVRSGMGSGFDKKRRCLEADEPLDVSVLDSLQLPSGPLGDLLMGEIAYVHRLTSGLLGRQANVDHSKSVREVFNVSQVDEIVSIAGKAAS